MTPPGDFCPLGGAQGGAGSMGRCCPAAGARRLGWGRTLSSQYNPVQV